MIAGFAFEIQELFGLLALRLTRLTVHRQPQKVQRVSLSKLVPAVRVVGNAMLKQNSQQAKEQKAKNNDFKSLHRNEGDDFILVDNIVRRNVL